MAVVNLLYRNNPANQETPLVKVDITLNRVGINVSPTTAFQIGGNRSESGWTTSVVGKLFNVAAATITDSDASGTLANRTFNSFDTITLAASNSLTITTTYGTFFTVPIPSTNVTMTTIYAVGMNGGMRVAAPDSVGYGVYVTKTHSDVDQSYGNYFATTQNFTTGTITQYGILYQTTANASGGTNHSTYGTLFSLYPAPTNSATIASSNNLYTVTIYAGSAIAGTVTNERSLYINAPISVMSGSPALTVTNRYGIYIANMGTALTGVTLTNAYGLYIANTTGAGTLNYAIYCAGGASYHAGNWDVGGVYKSAGTSGLASQVVVLAKITAGGANGSITVTGGIVTAYSAPT
jgi:hypothetical protein